MSGRGEPPDRLGRHAFFSQAQPAASAVGRVPEGKRALFSSPRPEKPTGGRQVVVECRTCLARTPLPLASVPLVLVPSLWLPGREWSRLIRCPNCSRLAWCRIRWSNALRR